MNGVKAEPWLKIINPPNNTKTIIIGNNQYFFLTIKNCQNSLIKDMAKIGFSFYFLDHFFQSNKFYHY